jgi:hypothetical protein
MQKFFVWIALAHALSANLIAGQIRLESGPKQVALLELYTSEGCSSCPPAEAWLARLQSSPNLWTQFAPAAYHVDYWNSLGWKDRWSSPTFTERQQAYARAWKSDNIYTPCFVLNGKEWHGWSSSRSIPEVSDADVGNLILTSLDANRWEAEFVPIKSLDTGYELRVAPLAGGLNSDVRAGENRGRHLQHEFVVLHLLDVPMAMSNGVARSQFILDAKQYPSARILALTAWVARQGRLEPLQAAGGWLGSPAGATR